MKKRKTMWMALLAIAGSVAAQGPWKMCLNCEAEKITLEMDLYEESITVPRMEMFGPMNGYLGGNIYGVWSITSFDIKSDRQATLRVSNDLGSETQRITLTQQSDSTWLLRFEGRNVVKRSDGKKLVKIPSELLMKKDPEKVGSVGEK
ncbi:MAG: hypothetical protein K5945_11450 [Bacteroidaceae bacterium]|nr:hypothetical protein [Bacteroidaceae bacterium]